MKKSLLLVLTLALLPHYSSQANNVNPLIEWPMDANIKFDSMNQNRIRVKVITDRTDDSNRDRPSLKLSIDNLDEATMREIVDCNLIAVGGSYYESYGSGKVLYSYVCDFIFQDKIQFDSKRLKLRMTATHLARVSFVETEIELAGAIILPTYKVDKIQFTADGQFLFQATVRQMNLKVPTNNAKFQICIDDFGCETASASSNGFVDYSRVITKANYTWLRVRITATVIDGSFALEPMTETVDRDKTPTPTTTPTPASTVPPGSNYGTQDSDSQSNTKPKTKMRSSVKVPVSAKLGVPFPVTISVKGSGVASCYFATYFSTNGWASYNTNGGTTSKRFQLKGGRSITLNGMMAVDYKGPWGVIVYCDDVRTKASLPIVVGRLIQN